MRDNAVTPNSSPSSMTTTVVPAFVHAPRLTLKLGNVLPVAVLSLCYDSNLNCSQREHSVRALISALFDLFRFSRDWNDLSKIRAFAVS